MTGLADAHVGLNLVFLVPGATGGTETYARELIPRLVRTSPGTRFTAFVNRETANSQSWLADVVEVRRIAVQARRRFEWVIGEQLALPAAGARARVDLLHSLANTGPLYGASRRVLTVHDLHYRTAPDAYLGVNALAMSVLVPAAVRRSHRVIAVSRSTAEVLRTVLHLDRGRVDVIPQGVSPARGNHAVPDVEIRRRFNAASRPIVLCVAAKRPHKNLLRLIQAVASIPSERRPVLVAPGYRTEYLSVLEEACAALDVQGDVHLPDWVDEETLEGLYAAASCVVCPSLDEGFGLPVLEAMVRGVPVTCSGAGALSEVAGDAALLFEPTAVHQIATCVERLLTDPAEAARLQAAGLVQASKFSWAAAAEATLATYAAALEMPL